MKYLLLFLLKPPTVFRIFYVVKGEKAWKSSAVLPLKFVEIAEKCFSVSQKSARLSIFRISQSVKWVKLIVEAVLWSLFFIQLTFQCLFVGDLSFSQRTNDCVSYSLCQELRTQMHTSPRMHTFPWTCIKYV